MKDEDEKDIKLEWRDILALMIAQLEILLPMALVSVAGMAVVLYLIMKVWLKT
ncbi:hypothetical protein [Calorimonas adulescens]|uniref:hypothetical protein n=1 Tax=Calorimonas adulescens TaxID=2606906 RepID=UPI001396BEFC|nr:hypothetical protein [Calorimonas adulescens]